MASASSLDKFVFLPKIFVDPPAIPKRILHFEHHQRSPLQTRLYLLVQNGAQRWSLWSNLALHCRKLSCFDRPLRLLGQLPFCPSSNVVMHYPSVVRSPPGDPWIRGHCSVTAIRTERTRRMEGEPNVMKGCPATSAFSSSPLPTDFLSSK